MLIPFAPLVLDFEEAQNPWPIVLLGVIFGLLK